MNIKRKILVVFVVAITLFTGLITEGIGAEKYTAQEWAVIINLSGKQRMLTQKMSKEILFISAGIDAGTNVAGIDTEANTAGIDTGTNTAGIDTGTNTAGIDTGTNTAGIDTSANTAEIDTGANIAVLKETAALFDKTLKGLQKGDSQLNLRRAKSTITKKTLEQVESLWFKFKEIVYDVIGGGSVPVGLVADQNIPLLKRMNTAVKLFEKEAQRETGGKASAVINYAGRQRMLIQKISKEMLLVYLKHNTTKYKASMNTSVEWFEVTLKALRDGGKAPRGKDKFVELPPTTDQAIVTQLDKVKVLWNEFKSLTSVINEKNVKKMSALNLPLLKEMNKAVKMYEKAQ